MSNYVNISTHSQSFKILALEVEALINPVYRNDERIIKIFNIIVSNGNYWKIFKKWSKEVSLLKGKVVRSDINQGKEIIQKALLLSNSLLNLIARLEKIDQIHMGMRDAQLPVEVSTTASAVPTSLKGFDISFLKETMAKNCTQFSKFLYIINFYRALESRQHSLPEKEFLESLQANLKVWILQYLTKGSKIPLLEQRGPIHLSFLDFSRGEGNNPEYYRFEGGPITRLFIDFIKKKHGFRLDENYIFDVINLGSFQTLAQAVCASRDMPIHVLKQMPPSLVNFILLADIVAFYDISTLLDFAFAMRKGHGVMQVMDEFSRICLETNKPLNFGGSIQIEGQECYLLFPGSCAKILASPFEQLRGSLGLVPEMSLIRHRLVRADFPLVELLDYCPRALQTPYKKTTGMRGTLKEVEGVVKGIQQMAAPKFTTVAITYFNIFQSNTIVIHNSILKDENIATSLALGPLVQAWLNIEKRMMNIYELDSIQSMNPGRKFQEILQEVNLISEQFSLVLCFHQPLSFDSQNNPLGLVTTLQKMTPESPFKRSYLCTSGMSSFRIIMDSLKIVYSYKINMAFLKGSYYELTRDDNFGGYLKQFTNYKELSEEDLILTPDLTMNDSWDVISMDIYPNFVLNDSLKKARVLKIIEAQLGGRTAVRPLTVILDTSTSFFGHEDVQNILWSFENEIKQGMLNIVVANSLAKFCMLGLDKYTGGVVQTYNNFTKISPFSEFNISLQRLTAKDIPSAEAANFFYLFLQNDGQLITMYTKIINKNTQLMYEMLKDLLAEENPIRLHKREYGIPMLGLSFKQIVHDLFGNEESDDTTVKYIKLTHYMQYFLAARTLHIDLSVSLRSSFAFASINITDCSIALRLSIGLEDGELLVQFAKIILELNNELKYLLDPIRSDPAGMVIASFLNRPAEDFVWIKEHKVEIISYIKNHPFLEVIEYISDRLDSEKIFSLPVGE